MGMAGDSDGIITLVKEAASDFGQLVADHIRLARVEMTADAKSYARDIAMLLVGAFVLAAGYGLACIAGGLALAKIIGGPLAFASLAFLHLLVGGLALGLMVRKMKRVHLMQETKLEVSRSVDAISRREFARTH
jgi:Putative Actinobacterial Holin-X, holin superfamily III